jgi:hypothetical protein
MLAQRYIETIADDGFLHIDIGRLPYPFTDLTHAKARPALAVKVRRVRLPYYTLAKVGEYFGVSHATVSRALKRAEKKG